MNKKLQTTFESVESQRLDLLSRLRSLKEEDLNWSPAGKWSILHIVSHLVTSERTALDYVRKKILGVERAGDSGAYEALKMFILVASQRLPLLKYKAPRFIEERTIVFHDIDDAKNAWDTVRAEWKVFLDEIPDRFVRRNIFRHVVAGRLNIEQGTRFFREHVIHHKPQIEALIRRAGQRRG